MRRLTGMLPADVAPITIADAGFKVPFYRRVEKLGLRWVERVRGRGFLRLRGRRCVSCQTLFCQATTPPAGLGEGEWVRSHPLRAIFVLVWLPQKGQRAQTAFGQRSRSKVSTQSARAAKEPWLLVAYTRLADQPPKKLAALHR